jgi:hypothetical protein
VLHDNALAAPLGIAVFGGAIALLYARTRRAAADKLTG